MDIMPPVGESAEAPRDKVVNIPAEVHPAEQQHPPVVPTAPRTRRKLPFSISDIIKTLLFLLSLAALIVLAVQVGKDRRDYNRLLTKYNHMVDKSSTTTTTPMPMPMRDLSDLVGRDVADTDYGNPSGTTSSVALATSAAVTSEVDALRGSTTSTEDDCTLETSTTATTVPASSNAVYSAEAESTSDSTTTTLTTVVQETIIMTVKPAPSSAFATSTAGALSGSSIASPSNTTSPVVTEALTATVTLSSLSVFSATITASPSSSTQAYTESSECIPGAPQTVTETVYVSPLTYSTLQTTLLGSGVATSLQSTTPTTTVKTTTVHTTVTTVVFGTTTFLVTQTIPASLTTVTTSQTSTSVWYNTTVSAGTTITITSTEAAVTGTGTGTGILSTGPPVATITSAGNPGPKPLAAGPHRPSITSYCTVMLVAVVLFILH